MDRAVSGRQAMTMVGRPENKRPASLVSKRSLAPKKEEAKEAALKKALGGHAHQAKLAIRIVVLAVVCIYAAVSMILLGAKYAAQEEKLELLKQRRDELQSELAVLAEQEEYIGSAEYIEQAARAKLGWVKQGEMIFQKDE